MKNRTLFGWLIVISLFLGTTLQVAAIPAIFLVNSTGDQPEATPDSDCETVVGNGVCTLRAAIQLVNARNNGGDGIAIGVTGTITLNSALPNINVACNIGGPGPSQLVVQPNSSPGTFRIFNVTTTGTVSISGLTINGGRAIDSQGGGAIRNFTTGVVNVTNCVLSNNLGIVGGAIANSGNGQVFVTNCNLSNNMASLTNGTAYGGGIYNPNGYVNITGSTLFNNTVSGGGDYGYGGGIYNNGTLIIASSTIASNTATGHLDGLGGGIYNFGQLEVTNSTILQNTATSDPLSGCNPNFVCRAGVGAGIYNLNIAIITNSTIAYNYSAGGSQNFDAGGIQTDNTATHIQVKSCIIAQNIGSGPDVSGAFTSGGFNLIGAIDSSTGFTAATDQTGTEAFPLDPKFDDQLGDNSGPTRTLALLCGSPAIDKGTSNGLTGTLTTDQRGTGFARTVDDAAIPNASGGDGTDIGAFEYGSGPIMPTTVVSRKFHGTGSPPPHFDIPLSLSCTSLGIECRRNTGSDTTGANVGHDHELIVTFGSNVTVGSVDVVNDSTGFSIGSATFGASNNVVTVDLHSIPNPARLTINLRGVSDGTNSGLVSIPMGVLLGDTTGEGFVNSADISQTKSKSGQSVTSSNFREDVNVDGFLNSADISFVKSKSGTALP